MTLWFCYGFAKLSLYIINAIFLVIGFFTMVIGCILLFDIGGKILLVQLSGRLHVGAGLMYFGFYLVFYSFFGFCVTYVEHRCGLLMYGCARFVLMIVNFVIGIWALCVGSSKFRRDESYVSPTFDMENDTRDLFSDILNAVLKSEAIKTKLDNLYDVGIIIIIFWVFEVVAVASIYLLLYYKEKVDISEIDQTYDSY